MKAGLPVLRVTRLALAAVVLSSCASAPSHYYSLSAPQSPVGAVSAHSLVSPFAIDVAPVTVPDEVNRPQIMIGEEGDARIVPLKSSLWASPLDDQIRTALGNALSARLGVPMVPGGAVPEGVPVWRIQFQAHRFESQYGRRVLLDASWQLRPINQKKVAGTLVCRGAVSLPVEQGVSALVQGHEQALQRFATVMAEQIRGGAPAGTTELDVLSCT